MPFPDGFIWGTATAAYQVEGAAEAAGRGRSIWDAFCRKPGATRNFDNGDVACDHYHRLNGDLALMRDLGIGAYRFSIAWPRVIPGGVGTVNQAGLDFYDRLVDGLLAAGIRPFATLFHWDYPEALYFRGGWLNRESVEWFADYARLVARRLGVRVQGWMTLNEPQCSVVLGHSTGEHAPGLKLSRADVLRVAHHHLLAHGRAVQELRAHCALAPTIGWAPVGCVTYPASERSEDVEAAREAMFQAGNDGGGAFETFTNTLYSDPVCLGRYPEDAFTRFGADMPAIDDEDLVTISQPLDFYGVNIYQGACIRAGEQGPEHVPFPPGFPRTCMDWPVTPQALRWGPRFLAERYGLPVIITENGLAGVDLVDADGGVHDGHRITFTASYLRELERAIADGVDVRGYFHWSMMDNFEWAFGYERRFGLIHVDYQTLKRTPKDSFHWYGEVIASNGASLGAASASGAM